MTTPVAKFLWLDLETTGLEAISCTVLEVAAIVTDAQLNEMGRFHQIVHHDVNKLMMSKWPWKQHSESGLLQEVEETPRYRDRISVDIDLADFIKEYDKEGPLTLAGSSVHFDLGFMKIHLPNSYNRLHYRLLDVSILKVVASDWWPDLELPKHTVAHRATQDIDNSLELGKILKDKVKPV
jgi:oligoribonuclease